MTIDLTRLRSNIDKNVLIDLTYSFNNEELEGTDIKELNNVIIKGEITKDSIGNYNLDLKINGIMVLPCAITLKPTNYPFETEIHGDLLELLQEIDENVENISNSLDIFPIVWENILLEIPMKVVSDEIDTKSLKGDGWKFITEEKGNTPFDQLKDLLK